MSHYGSILDETYNPSNEGVYRIFINYFDNPDMIKSKTVNNFSIYMNRVYGMLCNEQRYIVAVVPEDGLQIGNIKKLSTLEWVSFQTRTSSERYEHIRSFVYDQKRNDPYNTPIRLVKRTESHCEYISDNVPITLTLIIPKGKSMYEYQPNGTIASALETYNTIITIRNGL